MKDRLFQNYSRKHVHFYGEEVSVLLELCLTMRKAVTRKPNIVDLGCGDGRIIFALYERGAFEKCW
mgnify:CR=1 FL=1